MMGCNVCDQEGLRGVVEDCVFVGTVFVGEVLIG